VLTGRGDKAFGAGGDLRELQALDTAPAIETHTQLARSALAAIRHFPVPVVAALNGDALGGGLELAMACDVRVAAPHARLAFLQGTLALPSAWGGTEDLVHDVGPARALELLASSRRLSAHEALALGLVQFVAGAEESFDAWTSRWLETWSHQRPQVMRALKANVRAMREGVAPQERAARSLHAFVDCWLHPDHLQAADRKIGTMGR
ncbi:MAG TPA: enoyl-CoA hydratase/isomerase family protein, partial [Nevskiaceae bacterium]|nr:enoyl-CoA hydratase/isomerase family protein [Nevskiaceae bacterium]